MEWHIRYLVRNTRLLTAAVKWNWLLSTKFIPVLSCIFSERDKWLLLGNGFKQKGGRFKLAFRRKFFTQRVVRQRHRFPREVVAAPSLEVFRARLDEWPTCFSGWHPCPWQGGCNWVVFKAPSNLILGPGGQNPMKWNDLWLDYLWCGIPYLHQHYDSFESVMHNAAKILQQNNMWKSK